MRFGPKAESMEMARGAAKQAAYDVITKTPAADGKPMLALAGCNAFEFLDVMPPEYLRVSGFRAANRARAETADSHGCHLHLSRSRLLRRPFHQLESARSNQLRESH